MLEGVILEYHCGLVETNRFHLWRNSSETDPKKKASLKKTQKRRQIMPPVTKNKKVDSNAEIENSSVDFSTLTYAEGSVNACDPGDESE